MRWLSQNGLVATYADYLNLPQAVLEDARLLMEAEARRDEKQRKRQQRNQPRVAGKRR